jgi:membrane protease YdiL (CAAX protease family)
MNLTRRQALTEALIVWALAILTARIFYSLRLNPFINHNLLLFTSGIFIYLPAGILIYRKEPIDFFERSWKELFYSLKVTLLFSLIVFPPVIAAGSYLQTHFFHSKYYALPNKEVFNGKILNAFAFHLLLVAFPEEFFFRGYLLRRFRQVFQDRFTFLGVLMGKAFFLTALLFALSHSLIVVRWWHIFIFFPALAFGWLREKTGFLTAAILFHALSNTFAAWLGMHYR